METSLTKGDNMQKYNKLITAVVGAVVSGLSLYFNSPDWLQLVIPMLTALGVYQVRNEQ